MKKNNVGVIIIITILISFICGSMGAYLIMFNNPIGTTVSNITGSKIKLEEKDSISESVESVYDAVVVVEGFAKNQLASTGTGFVYKQEGNKAYVMTNHHVVNGCESVKLILSDAKEIDAKVKGSEAYSDIAVLEVDASKIKKIAVLGDSNKSRVGDTLFAVGSPEGADYAGTVTKGILSGKDRMVAVAMSNTQSSDYYMKVLQTDAAINPGNSGGPICNINGEVIGITNMKLVDSSVEGMGFAIPIEDALYYSAILEKGQNVSRPFIGIGMLDLSDEFTLWQNRITLPKDVKEGVVIIEISDNSPASKAKLKKGDVIIELAGKKIKSSAEFRYELYKHKPGEKIEIKYIRDNKENKTTVTLTNTK